jgi:hypothetical protein
LVASDWGNGFTANVTVSSTGATAANGWTVRSAARSAVPVEFSLPARRRTVLGEDSISNLTCVSRLLMISVHIRTARWSRRVRADHAGRAGRIGDRIAAWDAGRMAESSMPRAS